jgi:hypothetical protein
MDASLKLEIMRALAVLPFFVFLPLLLVTLLTPMRVLVERRIDRRVRRR